MAANPRRRKTEKKVTRYTYDDIKEPRTPETGHTSLLPADEQVVTLPMDNGWSKAIEVGKLPEGDERPVVVDMDPAADPVLFWAGKRNRREVPVLPLQRNEIVSESRIAQIIERARRAAEEKSGAARQGHLFADLEKTLRETDRSKRVEFYTHEEGWKNKLICGDSLHVMESLLHYENLRGKVQMIYIDPPYGIKYDSNFQQRVDSTKNDEKDAGRRCSDDQGVSGHVGAWGPFVPVVPAGAALPMPRAAGGHRERFRSDQRRERASRSRCSWTRCSAQTNFMRADHLSQDQRARRSNFLASVSRLPALVREGQATAASISQLYREKESARMARGRYTWSSCRMATRRRLRRASKTDQIPLPTGREVFRPTISCPELDGESEAILPFEFEGEDRTRPGAEQSLEDRRPRAWSDSSRSCDGLGVGSTLVLRSIPR